MVGEPEQGLRPDELAGREVEDRLVGNPHGVIDQGIADQALHPGAFVSRDEPARTNPGRLVPDRVGDRGRRVVARRGVVEVQQSVEDDTSSTVALLGGVESCVGIAEQHVGRDAAVAECQTTAEADLQRHTVDHHGLRDRSARPLHHTFGIEQRVDVRQQQDELVASHPGDGVALANRADQPSGNLLEDLVAGVVPMGVVDLLEVVDVAEADADMARSW
jgi:hypothetical protein